MRQKTLIAALLMCSVSAYAQTVVWTGNVNDWDWNENGNFQGGVKPVAGDVVEIPPGKVAKIGNKDSADLIASLAQVHVAEGATLYTWLDGVTTLKGLYGAGLVTNEVTELYRNLKIEGTSDFSGKIAGRIYYLASGNVMLRGTDNAFAEPFSVCSTSTSVRDFEELAKRNIGYTGVMKIGKKGESSSVGVDNDIRTIDYGGGLLYLGTGETTDRSFSVLRPNKGLSFIDGGATGGLVWEGDIILSGNASNNGMGVLGLIGSNTIPCVVAGNVKPRTVGSETYNFFFEKAGIGTWRFADTSDNKSKRNFFTSMAIRNGTLQFDSMEEAGIPCALGLATNLTALYYGARNDAAHPGKYAYWLGAPGKLPVFEYTGNKDICVSTRPIALEGDAKLKNDTLYPWRFSGVVATTAGAKELFLSGEGAAENEIAGIQDSPSSPISIVKEGTGSWIINGSNTFSGKVSVKAGTLSIRRDVPYSWFRWTITNKSYSEAAYMYLTEFALYDENGVRINQGLSVCPDLRVMAPGTVALPKPGSYYIGENAEGGANRSLTALVDGMTAPCLLARYEDESAAYEIPLKSNPDTHLPILMRLDSSASHPKYYDVCIHYPVSNDDVAKDKKNRRCNPNSWKLEASADGIFWKELHSIEDHEDASLAYVWASGGIQYKSTAATESGTSGYPIPSYPDYRVSPNFSNTVSIAAGATLKAIGEVVLSSMEIDAVNAGTVDGFSFAESGELNVKNVSGNGVLGGTFVNSVNLVNLKNWSISVNGSPMPGKMISVSESGSLSLVSRGLVFSVR